MKVLIAEDDLTSRLLLKNLLKPFCVPEIVVNGKEAIEAVDASLKGGEPYSLIFLDIMMPEMDGQRALRVIRELEEAASVTGAKAAKIIMTTALEDADNIMQAFHGLCDAYLVKPILRDQLLDNLEKMGLISQSTELKPNEHRPFHD